MFLILAVLLAAPPKPVVCYYTTDPCIYCRKFDPEWEAAVKKYPDIEFRKYDLRQQPEVFKQQGITSYPTVDVFFPGKDSHRQVGYLKGWFDTELSKHKVPKEKYRVCRQNNPFCGCCEYKDCNCDNCFRWCSIIPAGIK